MAKKHTFRIAKLIRNKLPSIMRTSSIQVKTRTLKQAEYRQMLKKKLIEESQEVNHAPAKASIQEELADVLEVVHALCQAYHITLAAVELTSKRKKAVKGDFDAYTYVEHITIDADTPHIQYYLDRPTQYPEVE